MKRSFTAIAVLVLGMLACQAAATPTSQVNVAATIVAATMQAYTEAAPLGTAFTYNNVSFVVPDGMGSGASGQTAAAKPLAQAGQFLAAPEHVEISITGYPDTTPHGMNQIRVYPAQEFAAENSWAAQCLVKLRAELSLFDVTPDNFPGVPFILGGGPMVMAQVRRVDFSGGSGVRALTQYGEHAGPISNQGLFYEYQGLTKDGKYYVVATMSVSVPFLAYDPQANPPQPTSAPQFPAGDNPDAQQLDAYYKAVTDRLNISEAVDFVPSLDQLDNLFRSVTVR